VTTPTTIHPPLTRQQFEDGCGYTYRGVSICEDENATWVYAYGHIDPAEFVKVLHDYDIETAGVDEPYAHSDVQHRWATTTRPAPDWWIDFPSSNTAETPGAFPVTVVAR
jgi:hypothetical protein